MDPIFKHLGPWGGLPLRKMPGRRHFAFSWQTMRTRWAELSWTSRSLFLWACGWALIGGIGGQGCDRIWPDLGYLGMAYVYIVGTQMLTVRVICISSLFSFVLSFFFPLHPLIPYGSKYFPRRYLDAHGYTYFLDLRKTMVACMPLVFLEIHPFLIPCVLRIHCQGSKQPGRAGLFGTTCAGISSEPKSAPQLGKTCELRSEVAMRPSFLASWMVIFRIFPEPCGRSMRIQIFRGTSLKEYVENPWL